MCAAVPMYRLRKCSHRRAVGFVLLSAVGLSTLLLFQATHVPVTEQHKELALHQHPTPLPFPSRLNANLARKPLPGDFEDNKILRNDDKQGLGISTQSQVHADVTVGYARGSQPERSGDEAKAPVDLRLHPQQRDVVVNASVANPHMRCVDPEGEGHIQDLLCTKRRRFLSKYKNPCFVDWSLDLQRLRCMPYFHVLGVDKSGTTDLHSRIAQHPHVLLNEGGLGKETYYWCWLKYGQWMRKSVHIQSFNAYLKRFDKPAVTIAENPSPDGYFPLITGDGTPMDFWDFRAWPLIPQNRGLKEPAVLTPHIMRHVYPDPKFILIFRNPVDRLYSDYIFLGYGFTPEKFAIDVPKAVDMMESCLKVNTTRQCVFSNDTYVNLPMRIHVGMYSVFMKEWLSVFSRSSFYILRTEDYHVNMTRHLSGIYKFLGLDPLPEANMSTVVGLARKHETKAKKKVSDMFPETRRRLQQFYGRYNEELAGLLQDPAFLWPPSDNVTAGLSSRLPGSTMDA